MQIALLIGASEVQADGSLLRDRTTDYQVGNGQPNLKNGHLPSPPPAAAVATPNVVGNLAGANGAISPLIDPSSLFDGMTS